MHRRNSFAVELVDAEDSSLDFACAVGKLLDTKVKTHGVEKAA